LALENAEINSVVRKINEKPMKCLGFKTPAGIFAKRVGAAPAG
jgi:IS30 family transposase